MAYTICDVQDCIYPSGYLDVDISPSLKLIWLPAFSCCDGFAVYRLRYVGFVISTFNLLILNWCFKLQVASLSFLCRFVLELWTAISWPCDLDLLPIDICSVSYSWYLINFRLARGFRYWVIGTEQTDEQADGVQSVMRHFVGTAASSFWLRNS